MASFRRFLKLVVFLLILWLAEFSFFPLSLPSQPYTFDLKSGMGLRAVAHQLKEQGLLLEPWSFIWAGRLLGQQGKIKAGSYEFNQPLSALRVLIKVTRGDSVQGEVKLIEGMTFAQFRGLIDDNPDLGHESRGLTNRQLLARLNIEESAGDGLFYPETYFFNKGGDDWSVFRRARQAMDKKLAAAWQVRAPGLPLDSPYQALILASIVEKETAKSEERALIASVFLNRLRLGMRLQTDPTVIYGLGDRFDGNLHKRDLTTDTPYNTYTRAGLPPTPIAMPSLASIEAVLHPAASRALYFVSKGNGSHQFSENLEDHNRAVLKYQILNHGRTAP